MTRPVDIFGVLTRGPVSTISGATLDVKWKQLHGNIYSSLAKH